MVHAIEAFTGRLRKNPLSDILAKETLRLMAANLITAFDDGQNRQVREAMLMGATLAGQAFSNSPVGAVHALAYPLEGHFHLPHGLTNALMLGPVLRHNMRVAAPLYAELADLILWRIQRQRRRTRNGIRRIHGGFDEPFRRPPAAA